MYENTNILDLLICIESLELYNNDRQKKNINCDFYNLIKNYPYSINLLKRIHTFILKKANQEKVTSILYKLSQIESNREPISQINLKYINRFLYKYKFHYSIQKHHTIGQNKREQITKIAIINLYLLHKILSNNSTYFLYKYIHSNKNT